MFLWSTEPASAGRREVPLTPRHSAGLDILWELGPARTGVELFYTGAQGRWTVDAWAPIEGRTITAACA